MFKHTTGVSREFARIPKRVMWNMLATKAADRITKEPEDPYYPVSSEGLSFAGAGEAHLEMVGLEEQWRLLKMISVVLRISA